MELRRRRRAWSAGRSDSGRRSAISDTRVPDFNVLSRARDLLAAIAWRHATTNATVVMTASLGYPGGMVSYYTAKVAGGKIVLRDVGLPDGTEVNVTVESGVEYQIHFTPEVEADIRASRAEHRRGESISGEEWIAEIQRTRTVHGPRQRTDAALPRGGARPVARASRNGAKSTRGRNR